MIDQLQKRGVRVVTHAIGLSTALLLCVGFFVTSSCVETAECDETVGCTEGRVCYDLKCRERCTDDDGCGAVEVCAPCQEDRGAGVEDHCFETIASVCVEVP